MQFDQTLFQTSGIQEAESCHHHRTTLSMQEYFSWESAKHKDNAVQVGGAHLIQQYCSWYSKHILLKTMESENILSFLLGFLRSLLQKQVKDILSLMKSKHLLKVPPQNLKEVWKSQQVTKDQPVTGTERSTGNFTIVFSWGKNNYEIGSFVKGNKT